MVALRARGLPDCRPLLADPADLIVVLRPLVDLAGATVAGYEALARFPGTAGPGVWLAAAADAGLAAELEALLVHRTLERLPHLRSAGFLLLAVQADLLGSGPVQDAFASRPSLHGLVVELRGAGDLGDTARLTAGLRARGARPAGGPDAGADLAVLDRDTTRAFAATGLGPAGGPPVLADDLETPEDLTAAVRCGAVLGRGWLFGPPSSAPRPLAPSVVDLVRTRDARVRTTGAVLPLVRPVRLAPDEPTADVPALDVPADGTAGTLLVVDRATGRRWRRPVTAVVLPTTEVGAALRLALDRPVEHRFDPVLCADEDGRPLGLLRVAELARAGAR